MKSTRLLPALRNPRAFTLLEVALVVAIVGMMLLMIIGYLFAPKKVDKLPPVQAQPLIPPSDPSTPAPKKASSPTPRAATPAAALTAPEPAISAAPPAPAPAAPAPAAATPAPTQTIDLSPQSSPIFR